MDTVRITEVKGHADEGMVRDGGVRAGLLRQQCSVDFRVIDARRTLLEFVWSVASGYSGPASFLLLSPGLWLIMWMEPVLHLILWSGLLVLFPKA